MSDEHSPHALALFERQLRLQSAAATVITDLKLYDVLTTAGTPKPVGSMATGLMVWRDIDFTVVCDNLEIVVVTDIAASLATHPRVRSVEFRNDSGHWNEDESAYPDGLFLGIEYVADEVWGLDIWFVDEPGRQPDLAHVRELSRRLTDELRAAILEIKEASYSRPGYSSHLIYEAVLDHDVRSLEEFQEFIATT
jgi:hypothetical protein